MTGDELAAELYRRQGFLILGSDVPLKIGEIISDAFSHNILEVERISHPLVVTAPASSEEMDAQDVLARKLLGITTPPDNGFYRYFYRAETD